MKKDDYIVERRFVPLEDVEVREDGATLNFRGHAAVFDQVVDLGPWREQIAPGAFKKTIREADVRFLYNHEPDSVMSRTKNGTLRLREDKVGLNTDADLDPNDWDVQRLVPKLKSRNVDQMSFAFRVVGKEGETWDDDPEDGGKPIRTLREVGLFDVSAVTFPAYPSTDGGLRKSIEAVAERRGIVCSWDDDEVEVETERAEDLGVFPPDSLPDEQVQVLHDCMTEVRASGAAHDLPLADKGGGWDGAGARARVQAWAGGEDWSPLKYRKAFLYFDAAEPDLLGSYKLPFADVRGGSLKAVPEGIYAAAQRLGGTNIPDADKATAKSVLSGYYSKLGEEPPWERDAQRSAEDAETSTEKDTGASGPVTEDATAPSDDSAPAASEPDTGPATETPRAYDAATLWERIAYLKTTL